MDQWMKDAVKRTELVVTTRSGFKIRLQDAGEDKFGNRLWRELKVTLGGDA